MNELKAQFFISIDEECCFSASFKLENHTEVKDY